MFRNVFFTCINLASFSLVAQNTPPQITIQSVVVDEVMQQVSITYDLADAENHNCDVWLKVSENGGGFYEEVTETAVSGDVGASLAPGVAKTMVWNYSDYTASIYGIKFRVFASDNQPLDIQTMVDQVDANSLEAYLGYIEGVRHFSAAPGHLNAIRDSIETNFLRYGLETERHLFPFNAQTGENILGRKPGMKEEAITFIIDGHYDGVSNSPGADDNGSAVAGMLEVLRILSAYDFEHSIRFIGFDFEETGLIGSQRYVQNAILPFEDIQGVLNLEMIGYYSDAVNSQTLPAGFDLLFPDAVAAIAADDYRGNFLVVCGNTTSSSLITEFVTASGQYVPNLKTIGLEVPGNGTIAPDLRRSDHAPFWDAGKKALMLTDGADTRNPFYHTPADTIGTLNFEFMTDIVKATLATLAELAVPISAGFDDYDLSILSVDDHHHQGALEIEVYPNPTNGMVAIKIVSQHEMKQRLAVYNLNGQIVESQTLNVLQGISTHQIDLTHLISGGYMLIFHTNEGKIAKSLIIE